MIKTDEFGFRYYKELPPEAKLIKTIWAFVEVDPAEPDYYRVKIGQKYLIFAEENNRYELYEITIFTQDSDLLHYINSASLFLLN